MGINLFQMFLMTKNIASILPYNNKVNTQIAVVLGYNTTQFLLKLISLVQKSGKNVKGYEGKWVYNSLESWHTQFFPFWSISTIRRIIGKLETKGLVLSQRILKRQYNHTKWYSIDENALNEFVTQLVGGDAITKKASLSVNLAHTDTITMNRSRPVQKEPIKTLISTIYSSTRHSNKNHTVEKEEETSLMKEVSQQMVNTWNVVQKDCINPIVAYVNHTLIMRLHKVFYKFFNGSIEKWKEYALKVKSSKFLMGEKQTKTNFKAQFYWLIKEDTITSILNGSYGVGDRQISTTPVQKTEPVVSIPSNVDEGSARKEFEEYVKRHQFDDDGDLFGMKKTLNTYTYSPHCVLLLPELSFIKAQLYQLFLNKKYA